jgi:hypothetical protein
MQPKEVGCCFNILCYLKNRVIQKCNREKLNYLKLIIFKK